MFICSSFIVASLWHSHASAFSITSVTLWMSASSRSVDLKSLWQSQAEIFLALSFLQLLSLIWTLVLFSSWTSWDLLPHYVFIFSFRTHSDRLIETLSTRCVIFMVDVSVFGFYQFQNACFLWILVDKVWCELVKLN